MIKLIVFLLIPVSFAYGQQLSAINELFDIYGFGVEDFDRITKVELKNDSLFVYKRISPNSNISCLAIHEIGETCSWNESYNVRDVYVSKNGKIALIETQHPKIVSVEEKIYTQLEKW